MLDGGVVHAYDDCLVPIPITGYMMKPNRQRYIDPDLEEDLQEACKPAEERASTCAGCAIKLGLAERLVRHCPACCKLQVVGAAFCWVVHCTVYYLLCGIGKPLVIDASIRAAGAKARAKVARVS